MEVLHDALRSLEYTEAKVLTTGNKTLHSALISRLLPQRRRLMEELLSLHYVLGPLYREQALMAREVAALYQMTIDHRNEQSRLLQTGGER